MEALPEQPEQDLEQGDGTEGGRLEGILEGCEGGGRANPGAGSSGEGPQGGHCDRGHGNVGGETASTADSHSSYPYGSGQRVCGSQLEASTKRARQAMNPLAMGSSATNVEFWCPGHG